MLKEFEKKPMMVVLLLVGIVGILFATLIMVYVESNEEIRNSLLDREIEHQESRASNFVLEINEYYEILGWNSDKLVPNTLSNGITSNDANFLKDSIAEEVTEYERISIVDKNGQILYQDSIDTKFDFENQQYVAESFLTKNAVITKGFSGDDGRHYFAYINPIINGNEEFEGYVEIIFPAEIFFNELTYHLSSVEQYLTVIDRDGFILFSSQSSDIGTYVFDDVVLEKFDFDQEMINNAERVILGGQTLSYPYPTEFGLFMATGMPVMINGNQVFTIYLTVPVSAIVALPQTIFDDVQNLTLVLISLVAGVIGIMFGVIAKMSNKEHKLRVDNMEKDLQIAKQDKLTTIGELTARIAHDLRNPLSTLKNSAELVQHNKDLKPGVYSQLNIMQRAIDRMAHQIDDVLIFVKKQRPEYSLINLKELLIEVEKSLLIPENIQIILPKDDGQIEGDRIQLQTVFSNLILNSMQSIGTERGLITVGISNNSDRITVSITDSGPGIPKEMREKVFDPLITTKQQGTGLGLASVRNIVKSHDGEVMVKSCKPAIFHVILPKSIAKNQELEDKPTITK